MILNTQKTQKGFSLLELLLVVAVGAILILAGLAIYRNITSNTDVNEASRLLNVLKQETQRLYQGQATYAGLDNTVLTNAGVVPARYTTAAGVIDSPFATNDVTAVINGADPAQFDIDIANVPADACTKLALEYNANDSDFVGLSIGGAAPIANPTVADVSAPCVGGAQMTWTFE